MMNPVLKELLERAVADMCEHFDRTFGELEAQIESVTKAVAHLDQKLEQEFAEICDELDRGFASTQAILNA